MSSSTVRGVLTGTARLRNSINGNPRYRLTLSDGRTFRTAADHSFVYGAMPADGAPVILKVGGRGTVVDWSPAEPIVLESARYGAGCGYFDAIRPDGTSAQDFTSRAAAEDWSRGTGPAPACVSVDTSNTRA